VFVGEKRTPAFRGGRTARNSRLRVVTPIAVASTGRRLVRSTTITSGGRQSFVVVITCPPNVHQSTATRPRTTDVWRYARRHDRRLKNSRPPPLSPGDFRRENRHDQRGQQEGRRGRWPSGGGVRVHCCCCRYVGSNVHGHDTHQIVRSVRSAAHRLADTPQKHVFPEARRPVTRLIRQHRRRWQHTSSVGHRAEDVWSRLERIFHPGRSRSQSIGFDRVPRRRHRRLVRRKLQIIIQWTHPTRNIGRPRILGMYL